MDPEGVKSALKGGNYLYYRRPMGDVVHRYVLGGSYEKESQWYEGEPSILIGDHSGRQFRVYPILEKVELKIDDSFGIGSRSDGSAISEGDWRDNYAALVAKGLDAINTTDLEKVVLAASYQIKCDREPMAVYRDLSLKHTDAHCFLLSLEGLGIWIGASPEQLFVSKGEKVELMALAGTRPTGTKGEWGLKEIHEQGVVVRDMIEVLERCGYTEVQTSAGTNRRSGGMEHICTFITAQNPAPDAWLNLLQELHPSPALMGYPRELARNFLIGNEKVDRKLFTGYFGIHTAETTELAIMIRCARYEDGVYTLYAGAGINRDSRPEREVRELESKFSIMEEAILGLQN